MAKNKTRGKISLFITKYQRTQKNSLSSNIQLSHHYHSVHYLRLSNCGQKKKPFVFPIRYFTISSYKTGKNHWLHFCFALFIKFFFLLSHWKRMNENLKKKISSTIRIQTTTKKCERKRENFDIDFRQNNISRQPHTFIKCLYIFFFLVSLLHFVPVGTSIIHCCCCCWFQDQ